MFKSISITVDPGTEANDPLRTELKLCKGTITSMVIRPAPGPQREVYCRVEYREASLFPFDESEWIALERDPILIQPNWRRWDGTYAIDILACSPDARFTHTFSVEVEVEEGMTFVQVMQDFIIRGF